MGIRVFSAFILVLLWGPGCALANEGPSYADTVEFILQKAGRVDGRYQGGETGKYKTSFPYHCVLTSEKTDRRAGKIISYRKSRVPLEAIDPSTIDTFTGTAFPSVRLRTRDQAMKIVETVPDSQGRLFDNPTYISFVAVNEPNRNLDRVARAFRHLVSICGGKEELF